MNVGGLGTESLSNLFGQSPMEKPVATVSLDNSELFEFRGANNSSFDSKVIQPATSRSSFGGNLLKRAEILSYFITLIVHVNYSSLPGCLFKKVFSFPDNIDF